MKLDSHRPAAKNSWLFAAVMVMCIAIAGAAARGQVGMATGFQKVGPETGGFTGSLPSFSNFGHSLAPLGDVDGNGAPDLAVGAFGDGNGRGAVWILFLHLNGTVRNHQKISDTAGGFTGTLTGGDFFGGSLASVGDLDGNGVNDLAVGALRDGDGGDIKGVVWILLLHPNGTVKAHQKISSTAGDFTGTLDAFDAFGSSVAELGDVDGDGVVDLAVGALDDDDGGSGRGAVWILFLHRNGTVKGHQKISDTTGGFTGTLDDFDNFGFSVAALGDVDGNGVTDLAVGARGDDDGGSGRGAVWILLLHPDGTVKAHQKISSTAGDFTGTLDDFDNFGSSVAALGDLDGNGVTDLAIGALEDDDGGNARGAVWILFLHPNGSTRFHQKISDTMGGFIGTLDNSDFFGSSVAALGDVDGNGVTDLAVGARGDDEANLDAGAVWILLMSN